jgi:tetratricopeptide (TPR) repeat protein
MGNSLSDKGNLNEAIDCYKKAILIKPDYVNVHNNMGAALQLLNQNELLKRAMKKLLVLKKILITQYLV